MNFNRASARSEKDKSLVIITYVFFIVSFGLVILYSASSFMSYRITEDPSFYFRKQFIITCLGVFIFFAASRLPLEKLREFAPLMFLFSILLLIAVFIPGIGRTAGGAARWIGLGPLTVQPSDLARICLLILLAKMHAETEYVDGSKLILTGAVIALPVFLVFIEPDLGTAIHLLLSASALLLVTGFPLRIFAFATILALPILYIGLIKVAFRLERIKAWLDPWTYRYEGAYQLVASLKAFLAGGLFGQGLGSGLKRYNLQARHTDFILATVAQDLGLIGVLLCICGYFGLGIYTLILLSKVENTFARVLGSGLTLSFLIQFSLNAAVTMGIIPTTGITMPLLSYGGTSLVSHLFSFGLIIATLRSNIRA